MTETLNACPSCDGILVEHCKGSPASCDVLRCPKKGCRITVTKDGKRQSQSLDEMGRPGSFPHNRRSHKGSFVDRGSYSKDVGPQ